MYREVELAQHDPFEIGRCDSSNVRLKVSKLKSEYACLETLVNQELLRLSIAHLKTATARVLDILW